MDTTGYEWMVDDNGVWVLTIPIIFLYEDDAANGHFTFTKQEELDSYNEMISTRYPIQPK